MVNDKLSGYRLNSGKDPALFRPAGLKENDLAIALNGWIFAIKNSPPGISPATGIN